MDTLDARTDPPASGAVNMAADAALLDRAIAGEGPLWRWYRWDAPTLSLGHFQSDDLATLPALPRVRRLSGGGAILHDDEWTYSLAVPREHPHAREPGRLYRLVHDAIVDAAGGQGVTLRFREQTESDRDGAFLCFLRGDRNDLLAPGGTKVVGSAQRRRKGAVLQHGSLLWRRSTHDPLGLPGLLDLTQRSAPIDAARLLQEVVSGVATRLQDAP